MEIHGILPASFGTGTGKAIVKTIPCLLQQPPQTLDTMLIDGKTKLILTNNSTEMLHWPKTKQIAILDDRSIGDFQVKARDFAHSM